MSTERPPNDAPLHELGAHAPTALIPAAFDGARATVDDHVAEITVAANDAITHAKAELAGAVAQAREEAQDAARRDLELLRAEMFAQIAHRQQEAAAQLHALTDHTMQAIRQAQHDAFDAIQQALHAAMQHVHEGTQAQVEHVRMYGDQMAHQLQATGEMTHRQVASTGEQTIDHLMHLRDQLVTQLHDAAQTGMHQVGQAAASAAAYHPAGPAAPAPDPHALDYKYK